MKLQKRWLLLLLCVCLWIPFVGLTAAGGTGSITVGQGAGAAGDTVDIAVSLSGNPGLISAECPVSYDSTRLRLAGVRDTVLLRGGDVMSKDLNANPYKLFWDDSLALENNTANGVVAVLTFQILDEAPAGQAEITIDAGNALVIDADLNPVAFQFHGGSIQVKA